MGKVLGVTILVVLLVASTAMAEIKVYDADGQYLGILMSHDSLGADIFIPSMGKFINSTDYTCQSTSHTMIYETADCTGQPYLHVSSAYSLEYPTGKQLDHIYYMENIDKCYITKTMVIKTCNSYKPSIGCNPGGCTPIGGEGGNYFVIELVEIPKEEIPFTLPIALPLRFEYVSPLPLPVVTSFLINNGASYTTSYNVRLNNKATENPTHYMASEDSLFTGASWNAYSTAPYFVLSSGSGTKTVYFKVKNAGGESAVVQDSILKR